MYDRSPASNYRLIDSCEAGFGWLAHPDETGLRASHAFVGTDGDVWLIDPIDAPGIDAEIDPLGSVAGVAVFSRYHARDSGVFARRYDVPVYVPQWLGRVPNQLDAPIEYFDRHLGTSGFDVREASPIPGWSEAVAYRPADETLYVPDMLGTAPMYTVGPERLGVYLCFRPFPPFAPFRTLEPSRIRLGHGPGIDTDASDALETAFANARRGIPRALLENGPTQVHALVAALR